MSVGSIVKGEQYVKATFTIGLFSKVKSESQTMHTAQLYDSREGQTHRGPTVFSYSRVSQYIIKSKASVELASNICAQCDPT